MFSRIVTGPSVFGPGIDLGAIFKDKATMDKARSEKGPFFGFFEGWRGDPTDPTFIMDSALADAARRGATTTTAKETAAKETTAESDGSNEAEARGAEGGGADGDVDLAAEFAERDRQMERRMRAFREERQRRNDASKAAGGGTIDEFDDDEFDGDDEDDAGDNDDPDADDVDSWFEEDDRNR